MGVVCGEVEFGEGGVDEVEVGGGEGGFGVGLVNAEVFEVLGEVGAVGERAEELD